MLCGSTRLVSTAFLLTRLHCTVSSIAPAHQLVLAYELGRVGTVLPLADSLLQVMTAPSQTRWFLHIVVWPSHPLPFPTATGTKHFLSIQTSDSWHLLLPHLFPPPWPPPWWPLWARVEVTKISAKKIKQLAEIMLLFLVTIEIWHRRGPCGNLWSTQWNNRFGRPKSAVENCICRRNRALSS